MIDWKIKDDAPDIKGCDIDFWYDITQGGYIIPSDYLNDEQAEILNKALDIVSSFEMEIDRLIVGKQCQHESDGQYYPSGVKCAYQRQKKCKNCGEFY